MLCEKDSETCCMHAKSLESSPALCNPCSPPVSSVHGILQTRILEWVAFPFSRGSSQPRDQTCIFYASYHMQEICHQICRWHHPYGRKRRGTKEPLDESERSEWKSWFKTFNIQKTTVMASSPITSWQIDWETMETVTDFIFLDSKITADGDCSHEIKRHLLLGRKAMANLDSVL